MKSGLLRTSWEASCLLQLSQLVSGAIESCRWAKKRIHESNRLFRSSQWSAVVECQWLSSDGYGSPGSMLPHHPMVNPREEKHGPLRRLHWPVTPCCSTASLDGLGQVQLPVLTSTTTNLHAAVNSSFFSQTKLCPLNLHNNTFPTETPTDTRRLTCCEERNRFAVAALVASSQPFNIILHTRPDNRFTRHA